MSIEEIRKLIGRARLKKALEETIELARICDGGHHANTVVVLFGRYNSLESQKIIGTISGSEYSTERNRISVSLLSLLSDLEHDCPNLKDSADGGEVSSQPSQQGSGGINVTGSGNTIVVGVEGGNVHVGDNVSNRGGAGGGTTPPNTMPEVEETAPIKNNLRRVFISYAHADKAYKDKLKSALAVFERNGKIILWSDEDIAPGAVWEDEIRNKLNDADIVILLLSSDFLASDFVNDVEIPIIMERHGKGNVSIFPVLVRYCAWDATDLAKLQAVPKDPRTGILTPISAWGNKDEALQVVTDQIRRLI